MSEILIALWVSALAVDSRSVILTLSHLVRRAMERLENHKRE